MNEKTVSLSVVRRLPRYYRYLGMLLNNGVTRISSKELAAQMKVTAISAAAMTAASPRPAERQRRRSVSGGAIAASSVASTGST